MSFLLKKQACHISFNHLNQLTKKIINFLAKKEEKLLQNLKKISFFLQKNLFFFFLILKIDWCGNLVGWLNNAICIFFDGIWAIFYLCFALNFDNQPKSTKGLLLLFLKMEKVFIITKAQNYKLFLYKNISILQLCPLYNARNERHFKVFLKFLK